MIKKYKSLALQLFDINAIKFGAFKLKLHEKNPNAPLSPIYIDLRILRSYPKVMESAVEAYLEKLQGLQFDYLADVPTAATPIVAIVSHVIKVPMISPRFVKKNYGNENLIDGYFNKNKIVLLIDDLITNADSKMNAISVLESNDLKVHNIIVLIDREQGGVEELRKIDYICSSVFKLKELLLYYLNNNKIDKTTYTRTLDYLNVA